MNYMYRYYMILLCQLVREQQEEIKRLRGNLEYAEWCNEAWKEMASDLVPTGNQINIIT